MFQSSGNWSSFLFALYKLGNILWNLLWTWFRNFLCRIFKWVKNPKTGQRNILFPFQSVLNSALDQPVDFMDCFLQISFFTSSWQINSHFSQFTSNNCQQHTSPKNWHMFKNWKLSKYFLLVNKAALFSSHPLSPVNHRNWHLYWL